MEIEDKKKDSCYILGVEKHIIERFLEMIRDKYALVDKANFYLEQSGISGIGIAVTNQRDFVSHLATILNNNGSMTEQEQFAQLSAGEEHLRRAIIESYQNAVKMKLLNVVNLLEQYKDNVFPRRNELNLGVIPDTRNYREKLREINELRKHGRRAKAFNQWDEQWEAGVDSYVEAFLKSEQLEEELEYYLSHVPKERIKTKMKHTRQRPPPNQGNAFPVLVVCSAILNVALVIALLFK